MDLERLKIDRTSAPQRRRSPVWLPRAVAGAVVALVLIVLWIFWRPLTQTLDKVRLTEVRALRVELSHPAAVGAVRGMAANGYVVASRRAALSADTPGRIVELNVTEGSVVKKGDVVARLYDEEYAAALRRAEADVAVSEAGLTRAQAGLTSAQAEHARAESNAAAAAADLEAASADLALARQEMTRVQDLVDSKVATTRDLDRARSELSGAEARRTRAAAFQQSARAAVTTSLSAVEVARSEVEVAKAQVGAAQASRDLARATLDKTRVLAPFDGIVVLKDAEVGEVVSPNAQGGTSSRGSVATMVDFASLEVQADVPETSLKGVRQGGPVSIFLDAFPDRPYRGQVERIWPTANRQKATVEVRAKFLERDDKLRPEMGVRVVFLEADAVEASGAEDAHPAILVPEEAVVRVDGKDAVFVLERNVAHQRPVTLGERRGGSLEVTSGLTVGEQIVADPPPSLEDGARVRVQES